MDKLLYDLMDWAGIEELVYSESPDPHRILGAHLTENGMLVQAFIPTARNITVRLSGTGKTYPMEMADEAAFCGSDSEEDFDGLHAAGVL